MKIIKHTLNYYVNLMKKGRPFSIARYGDGEWLTILGFSHLHNSNGCTFSVELGKALRKVLKRENDYFHAILKVAKRERKAHAADGSKVPYGLSTIEKYLDDNHIKMNWYNGDVILDSCLKGKMFPLIEQIRERRVLYVGNKRLRGLNMRGIGFFPYVAYVQPPPKDAFRAKDVLLNSIFGNIVRHKIDFVGWSSGLASKVMIDEVFMRFPHVTNIDFGSSFDGFFKPLPHIAGKLTNNTGSRSYIRSGRYDFEKLRLLNTGKE